MKTITINGETIKISAAEQRALEILKRESFAAKRGEFIEGPRRWEKFVLPRSAERRKLLGIVEARKLLPLPEKNGIPGILGVSAKLGRMLGLGGLTNDAMARRHERFFAENPRCDNVVLGDPRRINAILRKVAI
jgi:hypothetical protein|tara:strand:- start:914 stop:1315 length:402 start_codon:yes stop_codon:yes gene_type:complete